MLIEEGLAASWAEGAGALEDWHRGTVFLDLVAYSFSVVRIFFNVRESVSCSKSASLHDLGSVDDRLTLARRLEEAVIESAEE